MVGANDGEHAVERASQDWFDVVVMDVRMPRLDGLSAIRQLRALGLRSPILALTADAVREHREECLAAGCDAYATKPIDIDALCNLVEQLGRRAR